MTDRAESEIERSYERVGWVLRLGMTSTKFGEWTCLLAMIELLVEVLAPRRLRAVLATQLWAPLITAGFFFVVAGVLLGIPVMAYRARLAEEWRLARMRKAYPPGCTCIFGALTDNPHCPHHGNDGGTL